MDIELRRTSEADLPDVMALWNDGRVMAFVGFPNGLGATPESMRAWLGRLEADASRRHFSIHAPGIGFCGEAYYAIDADHDLATLDIKLRPEAQGRGIASAALSQVLSEIFDGGLAGRAYVDPSHHNAPALRLYERLGFVEAVRPPWLDDPAPDAMYFEITPETVRRP
ncbi:MAG: GNAT family N-acetyltransferase [Chloroflexota bacterium]|nr:GNAT family N-acetyltransferase [Chloroflexota bacterium]